MNLVSTNHRLPRSSCWLAGVLDVPPPYMYCEEQDIADLLLALHKIPSKVRKQKVGVLIAHMAEA